MWDDTLTKRMGKKMSEALWTELEKMDVLRERMGIGYEEARTVLNSAHGDVVKALDDYEKVKNRKEQDFDFADRGQEIWNSIKAKIDSFSHSTVSLKKHENTIFSVSAPLGLALAYSIWRKPTLRMLAIIGAVGAAVNHFELEVSTNDKYPYNDDTFNFVADGVEEHLL
jgi:hypothetical protein